MKSFPKTIYIRMEGENIHVEISAEGHARSGESRTIGVYQLKEKVEITTQIKEEIVIKKSPKSPKKNTSAEFTPEPLPEKTPMLELDQTMDRADTWRKE